MSNTRRAGPYRPGGSTSLRGGDRLRRRTRSEWPPEGSGHAGFAVYTRAAYGTYSGTSVRPARFRKHRGR